MTYLRNLPPCSTANPPNIPSISQLVSRGHNVLSAIDQHAAFMRIWAWDAGSTVTVGFLKNHSQEWVKPWIQKTINDKLEPNINLTIKFINNANNADIRIEFIGPEGCYSMIGKQSAMDKSDKSMNLAWFDPPQNLTEGDEYQAQYENGKEYTFFVKTENEKKYDGTFNWDDNDYKVYFTDGGQPQYRNGAFGFDQGGTIVHEFCHAMGMIHEHQRPGAIDWIWSRVMEQYSGPPNNWDIQQIEGNITGLQDPEILTGSRFDPKSIMLYPVKPGLSRNYPNGLPSNPVLSEIDKKWLQKIYPTEPTTFKKYYFCKDEGCVETELESGYETMAECEQKCKKGKGKIIIIIVVGIIILLVILVLVYILSKKRTNI